MNMNTRLKDRVALVFGAGSIGEGWGNGKATAVAYARAGARVVAVDRSRDAALETVSIIQQEGGHARAAVSDVTNTDMVRDTIEEVVRLEKQIDILHNNVGFSVQGGPIETSEESWKQQIDVNLTSVFHTCKHALPHMLKRGKGVVINTSSLAAIRYTGYSYIAYYAAKAGVNQFTIALALEYASQGIRANAVVPGLMDTPLIYATMKSHYSDVAGMVEARNKRCPMGKMGTGWDVANAAVFLASDDASYITGVCLPVDGGLSCRAE